MSLPRLISLTCVLIIPTLAAAVPSRVQQVNDAVYMIHDDNGDWGGMTNGITHQNASPYQAKKILDLTDLPQTAWDQAKAARVSIYMMVRDYSFKELPQKNGLDEKFQVVVNGTVHEYPTSGGAPVYKESGAPTIAWYDLVIPMGELKRGPNEIIVRKAAGKPGDPEAKSDDYMYLGIDNSVKRGNSMVNFEDKEWIQDRLTIPGGNGEYMIRLYLLTGQPRFEARWQPGQQPEMVDPAGIMVYAGARGLKPAAGALTLQPGQTARVEWPAEALDILDTAQLSVEATGAPRLQWLDQAGAVATQPAITGLSAQLAAERTFKPTGLIITAAAAPVTIKTVALSGGKSFHPVSKPVNIAPRIASAKLPQPLRPSCKLGDKQIELQAGFTRAVFERGKTLRLVSLRNLITGTELLRAPDQVNLFLLELNPPGMAAGFTEVPEPNSKAQPGGPRLSGAKDFTLKSVKPVANGFVAELASAQPAFSAVLTATAAPEGLRLGLNVVNTGQQPTDFKVSFPHLSGLAVSAQPADDYYFFPSGGGIINHVPALIRRGYGDHEALYQVMDLYSPALGCGVSVRADDAEGWHKILALRKYLPGQGTANEAKTWSDMRVRSEYRWLNSLDAEVEGTSLAYDYLRRTRAPGAGFQPASAVIAVHPGDWHTPMKEYSAWAHRVWKFRPFPSKLKTVHNMLAAGWGWQGALFKDGKYRTDFIKPMTDCIELMSWWDWSPLGPFMTPFDQLDKVLTPAQIKMWETYFVKDPVTGQKMWNNQPGDYRGYNERFGGLPAFQKAVQTYKDMGSLTTLYTDPFRLDENCETGKAHGKEWCVVGVDGKLSTGYEVYNPCHDLPAVREWVAKEMGRVMRETKADGIRLDEYGHRGWACYSPEHKHTYAEPGITQWQKATSEATRMVHEAMDKVNPGLVLTTEHPGYDYLMQYLEGCITYDLTVQKSPLRPLECNNQRFYFPECKAYELDHQGADPLSRKKFWNAVESFGRYYPVNMYNTLAENDDVYQGRDNQPLVATTVPYIYANRFSGGGKTMYHLYNALGHTYEGPVLQVAIKPGQHAIELLSLQELPCEPGKPLSAYIARDDVACVAILPQILTVAREGQTLQVTATKLQPGKHTLVVVNEKGEALLTADARAGQNKLDLSTLTADAKPIGVKLLREGQLVDAVALR